MLRQTHGFAGAPIFPGTFMQYSWGYARAAEKRNRIPDVFLIILFSDERYAIAVPPVQGFPGA
jgi:hypothetical protein